MDYLFFDIECANCEGGNGKICSFGYVLTDEKFEVIEKRDVLINPKAPFRLSRGGNDFIKLAYPESEFLEAPDFGERYEEIKALLTAPDRLVVGHAVVNDVGFIRSECKRYGLPQIEYKFADTQRLYKNFANVTNQTALEKVAGVLGVEVGVLHRSDEDAYMTMMCAKRMCEVLDVDLVTLLSLVSEASGRIEGEEIKINPTYSKRFKGVYLAYFNAWYRRFSKQMEARKPKFYFSVAFRANYRLSTVLLEKLYQVGSGFSRDIETADYVVINYGERSDLPSSKLMTPSMLAKCLNYDEKTVKTAPTPDYEAYLSPIEADIFGSDRKAYSVTESETNNLSEIFDKNKVLKALFGDE